MSDLVDTQNVGFLMCRLKWCCWNLFNMDVFAHVFFFVFVLFFQLPEGNPFILPIMCLHVLILALVYNKFVKCQSNITKTGRNSGYFVQLEAIRRQSNLTHHANMSMQYVLPYTPLLYTETGVYRGIRIFLIFDPKHTLWVLVTTASLRWF